MVVNLLDVRKKWLRYFVFVIAVIEALLLHPNVRAESVAVTLLKDQTSEFITDAAGDALGRRAANIAIAYSKDFDSLFGTYNLSYLQPEARKALQSWASNRSRYWASLSVKAQAQVSKASKLALSLGVVTVLEQTYVAYNIANDIKELQISAPQVAGQIPDAAWKEFLANVVKGTLDKSIDLALQSAASLALSKALGVSLKTVGLPVTVVWGVFGNPETAGGSVVEEYMPLPTAANKAALIEWSKSMVDLDTRLTESCGGDGNCIERQASSTYKNAVWPGVWSWYKLKYEYFRAIGQPAMANTGAWTTKYVITQIDSVNALPILASTVVNRSTVILAEIKINQWNAATNFVISAKSTGLKKSLGVQLLSPDGKLQASLPMAPIFDNRDGSSDWSVDLLGDAKLKDLPDGLYGLRAVLTDDKNQAVNSAVQAFTVKREAVGAGGSMTTPPVQTVKVSEAVVISGMSNGKEPVTVRVIFTEPGTGREVPENTLRTANGVWRMIKAFPVAGSFPYRVENADTSGAKPVVIGQGRVDVSAVTATPPPQPVTPVPTLVANIIAVNANPTSIAMGQMMTFNAVVDQPAGVEKMELFFPEVNLLEPMTASGANTWTRARLMQQAGANRTFQIRLTRKGGALTIANGTFSVNAAVTPVAPMPTPPPQPVTPAPTPVANITAVNANPTSIALGQTMIFNAVVDQPAGVEKVELYFHEGNVLEPMTASGANTWTRARPMQQAGANRTFQIRLTRKGGAQSTANGTYTVNAIVAPVTPVAPVAPVTPVTPAPVPTPQPNTPPPLNYQLLKADNVTQGVAWSAKLTTNQPVATAELLFSGGRRIPFQGGPTNWQTDDRNAVFGDVASYEYNLRIRRQTNGQEEVFPGGQLQVRNKAIEQIGLTNASAASVEQGKAFALQVRTGKPVARVTVQWLDVSEGTIGPDATRTLWQQARILPQAGAMQYTVRAYDENNQVVGQLIGSVNVTAAAASIRVIDIARNIVVGESPRFLVAASMGTARVSVQLGNGPPVNLQQASANQELTFQGQVLAAVVGANVPYVINAYNPQGQVTASVTGNVPVMARTDALIAPNPVPVAGVFQGETVEWIFRTALAPAEMWMDFDAPIGRVPLNGVYLRRTFNENPGNYRYILVRKDQLGNVFPIQGASGALTIKPKAAAVPVISRLVINGVQIQPGGRVVVSLKGGMNAQAVAQGARGIVVMANIPPFGAINPFRMGSNDGVNWQSSALQGGAPTLNDLFRSQVKAGDYSARAYFGTGGTDANNNLGGTLEFMLQLVP